LALGDTGKASAGHDADVGELPPPIEQLVIIPITTAAAANERSPLLNAVMWATFLV
jgi:hypothetical protein